ncbi:MAG: transcriptional repressor [Proteobacteria bacterium]|nr:transcriptional repressor [Pseudomonadota bacterium]
MLIAKDVKPSIQRIKILEYIVKNRNHPTVDMIYNAIKDEIPTLSRTTVYNTLKELVKRGILIELLIDENVVRYDMNISPHVHFKCKVCGKIYDYDMNCEIFDKKEIDGNRIEKYSVYLYGTCKECLKKGDEKDGY